MSDPALTQLLAEIRRLHRRLDVQSQEHQAMTTRLTRIQFLLTELLERPERRTEIRDAALHLAAEEIDMPDDLRTLIDPKS